MKSFRLQFIDIDSSYTISTTTTAIKGFMVVRAPKGTEEAQFFQAGNEKHIDSMLGVGNANWPDLKEAVAFNEEYDLYVSAPAGTSSKYPSYYGGVYLTKYGLYDFWRVTDGTNPSYEVRVDLTKEDNFNSAFTEAKASIAELGLGTSSSIIKIENIAPGLKAKTSYFNFIWSKKEYELHISDEDVYVVKNGKDITTDSTNAAHRFGTCTLEADGTYTILLGGEKTEEGSYATITPVKGEPSILLGKEIGLDNLVSSTEDLNTATISSGVTLTQVTSMSSGSVGNMYVDSSSNKVYIYDGLVWQELAAGQKLNEFIAAANSSLVYVSGSGTNTGDIYVDSTNGLYVICADGTAGTSIDGSPINLTCTADNLKELCKDGFEDVTITVNDASKSLSFAGLKNSIFWRINIKDETALAIAQKSPNETPTTITLENIGYDKYLYNINVKYMTRDTFTSFRTVDDDGVEAVLTTGVGNKMPEYLPAAIAMSNTDNIFAVVDELGGENAITLYQYASVNKKPTFTDVTSEHKTETVYISGVLEYSGIIDSKASLIESSYKYTLWYVEDTGDKDSFEHTIKAVSNDVDAEYTPKGNVGFNTFTFSCKEEVYPGSYNDGGTFTGSTNPKGQDAQGSNIYFPNILPQDSVTYVNVIPVHTFEELGLVNTEGFWTGKKIVDKIGPADDTYTFTISGQRFCSYVNNMNIAEGKLGCAWRDEYEAIINAGLIEAQNNVYDDALVFMEPTGQECFKSKLMALRTTYHDTSTIISPKIINQAEFNNPKSIVIAGRSTGTAQYIGEFKMYDSYTGQYYWCQPIGDVGKMLARIMDKKLGGIAPAGTNNTQGLGGVLSRAVLSAKWNFVDSQLKIMDEKGVNAITYDADNGLMMQSQKTTQDPQNVTDWSYLGHSMSFDLCKREIRDKVMVPQLFKRINDYYMNIRQAQVDDILAKRITGVDPIWASAECSIKPVNTATTMAKRQFVMKVTCKVYVYSESCLLMFENLSQQ